MVSQRNPDPPPEEVSEFVVTLTLTVGTLSKKQISWYGDVIHENPELIVEAAKSFKEYYFTKL